MRNDYLIPANKSYVTQGSSIILYVNSPGTTPIVSIPSGKRACYIGSQNSGGTTYYQVRVYGVNYNGYSYVVGYIPSSQLAVDYGN
ncbi:MAG: hypothetical protein IJM21_00015 [Clostridia bacterium]|nr:hypothetical protein [Clostridia bacterium]